MASTGPTGIERPVVVMKFGGTSVATPEGRSSVAARVTEALELDRAPVVVVSAMEAVEAVDAIAEQAQPGMGTLRHCYCFAVS